MIKLTRARALRSLLSVGLSWGDIAQLFKGESLIDSILGIGYRLRFACRYAHNRDAINRGGPFPDAAFDANDAVFNTSISHASLIGRIAAFHIV